MKVVLPALAMLTASFLVDAGEGHCEVVLSAWSVSHAEIAENDRFFIFDPFVILPHHEKSISSHFLSVVKLYIHVCPADPMI